MAGLKSCLSSLLAIGLILGSTASGRVLYRCRIDGRERPTCCCRDAESGGTAARVSVEAPCCCDLQISAGNRQAVTLRDGTPDLPSGPVAALFDEAPAGGLLFDPGVRPAPRPCASPPSSKRSTRIQVCSFLI